MALKDVSPTQTSGDQTTITAVPSPRTKVWGDDQSGHVLDQIFISNSYTHLARFQLRPGQSYRDSADFKSLIGGDVVYYVLEGELTLANPENGEIRLARAGHAFYLAPDTWHHGFNFSEQRTLVLEFIGPPPAHGTTFEHFDSVPIIDQPRYSSDGALEGWQSERSFSGPETLTVIRDEHVHWRIEGQANPLLVGIFVSTPNLVAGRAVLPREKKSDRLIHRGGCAFYVEAGRVIVADPAADPPAWLEIDEGEACYIPPNTSYELFNMTPVKASTVFQVAPEFLPGTETG